MRSKGILFLLIIVSFSSFAAKKDNYSKIATPIMGWSSWNAFRVNISEDIIKRQADLVIEKGLFDYGYNYVNIDDGFFGERDNNGKMHSNKKRFPNEMTPVVNHIHKIGMKAGIYTDAGNNTCGSIWDKDTLGIGAGIYGHERQDAELYFNEWGFDFIKIDYCGGGSLQLDEKDQYTNIYNTVNSVKKNVSINICRWAFPGTWARDIAASWRISTDISDQWPSIKSVVEKNLYLSAYAKDGHYNDMDMLAIGFKNNSRIGGNGLSENEEEAHFGMWCIMSSPLLVGCNLETIPESSLELLKNKELIDINQDPLGLQAYVVKKESNTYVLVKDILKKRGNSRAVAFYNPLDEPSKMSISFDKLELGGSVKVRNLTHKQDLGVFKGSFEMEIPAHSAIIYRMEAQKRLEPVIYEAEWSYLPLYDDIGKNKVCYTQDSNGSGEMKVSFLGSTPDNYAEWDNVFSKKGGKYEMTVYFFSGKDRMLEIDVNGKKIMLDSLSDDDERASVVVPITLKRGYNNIKMGNSTAWAPDIDCFLLKKK